MVKASEVRIGNYLLFEYPVGSKTQYKSERITNSFDGFRSVITINDMQLEKIHGIPITNEWLAKFGFKKMDKRFQRNWIIKLSKSEEHYSVQLHESKYWLSNSQYDAWCYVIKDVEYVHQLQNLYFDLTGEELKINEYHSAK